MRRSTALLLLGLLFAGASLAAGTKTVSGRIRSVTGKVLVVEKPGLLSKSTGVVEIELDDGTKISGQVAPGMHVKIKYRQDGDRKIALEVETRPEYASKEARKAAGQTRK